MIVLFHLHAIDALVRMPFVSRARCHSERYSGGIWPINNGSGRFSRLFEYDPFFIGVICGYADEELIVVKTYSEYREPILAELDSSGVPFGMTNCAILN
jgi:hypothetical protein